MRQGTGRSGRWRAYTWLVACSRPLFRGRWMIGSWGSTRDPCSIARRQPCLLVSGTPADKRNVARSHVLSSAQWGPIGSADQLQRRPTDLPDRDGNHRKRYRVPGTVRSVAMADPDAQSGKCRNWQTSVTEDHVPQGVWVRVPLPPPPVQHDSSDGCATPQSPVARPRLPTEASLHWRPLTLAVQHRPLIEARMGTGSGPAVFGGHWSSTFNEGGAWQRQRRQCHTQRDPQVQQVWLASCLSPPECCLEWSPERASSIAGFYGSRTVALVPGTQAS